MWAVLSASCLFGCQKPSRAGEDTAPAKQAQSNLKALSVKDTKHGTGKVIGEGDQVYVLYTGKLADGTVFDASEKHNNEPFTFTVGQGSVIKGWDQGLVGMKVGGERDLSVPADLAYGKVSPEGSNIPANSDLFFHIQVLDVVKRGDEEIVEVVNVKKGNGREAKDGDTVTLHYVGSLPGGKKFDSSRDSGQPLEFKIGAGKVVSGFDAGVRGMRVGGVRKMHIPPLLGYGQRGAPGKVPPNTAITFEVELLSVK